MDLKHWYALQNGSDIRGVATDGIPGETINLTPEIVERIAKAFALWLSDRCHCPINELTIGVGRDSRISGRTLMQAFKKGLTTMGATAIDCGLASTPAMFMATVFPETMFNGAVMLTASHLPFNRNGIKFFTAEGGLNKPDITSILDQASQINANESKQGTVSHFDLITLYSAFLIQKIKTEVNHPSNYETPLLGFHLIVDAGNGAGGFYAHKVLEPLGANINGSQFLEPDGMFPNHIPNPENLEAMLSVQNAVLQNKADLGIIFDTDVDRAAAVDDQGKSINRNTLIALIAAIILEEHPSSAIVTDSITSDGLTEFIRNELGGIHHRFKRGYKNVINEAIRLNAIEKPCWLAIETSGHAALRENFFLDDGAYLITKILIKAAQMRLKGERNMLQLISKLREPLETKEFRLNVLVDDFKTLGINIINDLVAFVNSVPEWNVVPDNYEGIRVSCNENSEKGWFLLRLSLHDPVIPVNIESDYTGGIVLIARKLHDFLKTYPDLDISSVKSFLNL